LLAGAYRGWKIPNVYPDDGNDAVITAKQRIEGHRTNLRHAGPPNDDAEKIGLAMVAHEPVLRSPS
jgi:hypothetical protein